MTKYIVAARIDENGQASGGSAGDQTGNEVMVQTLSSSGSWTYILRPPSNASKMVKQAYNAAANNNIGYDQNQRTTLYTQAKAKSWDLSKITTKCETDCSALVAVLCNCAGFSVSKDIYTGNEASALVAKGFTKKSYSESVLKVGDVLLRSGHTAIYVGTSKTYSSSSSSGSTNSTSSSSAKYTATLTIDGYWGAKTTKRLQTVLGTTVDGKISSQDADVKKQVQKNVSGWEFTTNAKAKGSACIKAMQKKLGATQDGLCGKATIKALQKRYGTTQDGYFSAPSDVVKALQKKLNKGTF